MRSYKTGLAKNKSVYGKQSETANKMSTKQNGVHSIRSKVNGKPLMGLIISGLLATLVFAFSAYTIVQVKAHESEPTNSAATGGQETKTPSTEQFGRTDPAAGQESRIEQNNSSVTNGSESGIVAETSQVAAKNLRLQEAVASNYKKKSSGVMLNQLPDDPGASVYSYENNLGKPRGQVEMDSPNRAAAIDIDHRAGIADFSFNVPLASLAGRGIDAGVSMTYNSRTWNQYCLNYDNGGQCVEHNFTYDVEQSWIAPGFSTGYGYLSSIYNTRNVVMMNHSNTVVKTLTEVLPAGIVDPDGTRHEIGCESYAQIPNGHSSAMYCTAFKTTDGSFIKVIRKSTTGYGPSYVIDGNVNYESTGFDVVYPNGGKITYLTPFGGGNSRKHYPYQIEDRNGNLFTVVYDWDQSGRINYIYDTLGRLIRFYYENDANGHHDKLVAITIPGMTANSEIQTVRFYYTDLTFSSIDTGFVSGSTVVAPTTARVLQYVYFPGTKTGYKYDYHSKYGMIRKITKLAGMSVDSTSTSVTGALATGGEGVMAASTEYDYPDGSTALDDVPKYTQRTDDWQGRTSAQSITQYNVPDPAAFDTTRTSTITVKNAGFNGSGYFDVEYKTISSNDADWRNGLVKETSVKKSTDTTPSSKTVYTWVQGSAGFGSRGNPMLQKTEVTNDSGLTKKTEFEYDQYGNQTKVKEYDYAAALMRTTEMEYETGAGWTNRNLLNLVKSVKVIVGGNIVSKTLYEHDHNGNGASIVRRDDMAVPTHDIFYNPAHPPYTTKVCPNDPNFQNTPENNLNPNTNTPTTDVDGNGCVNIYHPGYSPESVYRGNVTQIAEMLDVNATTLTTTNADVTNYEYDIAGNNVSATLSCCNLKTIDYGTSFSQTGYAYAVSQTKGSSGLQLTESVTYNYNTGLVLTSTDVNNQITNYEYESDTLRPHKTIAPNGGYSLTEYSDKLATSTSDLLPGYVRSTTTLDSSRAAVSYSYFDGRGASFRGATLTPDGWSIQTADFDQLGRLSKVYNPFYAATTLAPIPSSLAETHPVAIDVLGRTTEVALQDGTTVKTAFSTASEVSVAGVNKPFVTTIDQAGKQRRQVMDSLGRIVRVDEPTANGLGAVSNPNQPTAYEYDGNDNLIKTTQTDVTDNQTTVQERLFKYDSLSRLIAEKQVEANVTLNNDGQKVTSGGVWTKVLKYDPHGHITDSYDANGTHTEFSYDGLNRVTGIIYSDGTPAVTYTYDQARTGFYNKGALTSVATAVGGASRPDTPATATEFDYDLMGRAVRQRQMIDSQTYNLEYAYNLVGQMVSEKYPSGRTIQIGYDQNGRLASVAEQAGVYAIGYQYKGKGNSLSSYNLGNGTTESYTLNDRMQLVSQSLLKGTEVKQKYDYGYGQLDSGTNTMKNNGKLAQVESWIGTNKQFTKKYAYDELGRLKQEDEYRGDAPNTLVYRQNFDFDSFGNLYKKAASNPAAGQANPILFTPIEATDINKAKNRLASNTTYDDAGNVTQDTKFKNLNYFYDANGRMIASSGTASQSVLNNAAYDASGNRVAEKVDGKWKYQVYDINSNLVAEYTENPGNTGNISYPFQDSQGSTRATTDKVGAIQSRTDYQAFGQEIAAGTGQRTAAQGFNASLGINQKYGQTERDEATGLDHTWFRKHENEAGRWTSPDPYNSSTSIGDPQSFNKYSYSENEPTNFIDPNGLQLIAFFYPICGWSGGADPSFGCTQGIHFMYIPDPTEGGIEGGGGGGPGQQQSKSKKKKCKQADSEPGKPDSTYEADKPAILEKLAVAGVAGLISDIHTSGEGITFNINDRAGFLAILNNNDNFRHNTPFGAEHSGDVNANIFTVSDFRSFTTGDNTLGPDSVSGLTRSLQIDVGRGANNGPNNPQTARGYADLDCDNPAQDVFSFFKHSIHVIGDKLKKKGN